MPVAFLPQRKSIRLSQYDYSQPNYYFVTICTQYRECIFGDISNGEMAVSEEGKIVELCWINISKHFEHVSLDIFQIMPNHFHGIICINSVGARSSRPEQSHGAPAQFGRENPAPTNLTLGNVIAYFKYQSTKDRNFRKPPPYQLLWQRNFYEHIIRNDADLKRIREYIQNNPQQWDLDSENPNNFRK
jgi:putative transposase